MTNKIHTISVICNNDSVKDITISDNILKKMMSVALTLGIKIHNRDFDFYYGAAFNKKLDKDTMEKYTDIFNSVAHDECHGYKYPTDTEGFKAVEKHIDKFGMNSEEAEYMYELAEIDCWIQFILSKLNLTTVG